MFFSDVFTFIRNVKEAFFGSPSAHTSILMGWKITIFQDGWYQNSIFLSGRFYEQHACATEPGVCIYLCIVHEYMNFTTVYVFSLMPWVHFMRDSSHFVYSCIVYDEYRRKKPSKADYRRKKTRSFRCDGLINLNSIKSTACAWVCESVCVYAYITVLVCV